MFLLILKMLLIRAWVMFQLTLFSVIALITLILTFYIYKKTFKHLWCTKNR